MKKFILLLFAVCSNFILLAQPVKKNTGIQFFNGYWSALLDIAKTKNQIIFVDVYTDWCGPCKYMDKFIFSQQDVGKQYNTAFINYRLNAEKGEGIAIAKKYGVTAYPTFLFFNNSGHLIYKVIGEKEKGPFIQLAQEAVKRNADNSNLGNLEKRFDGGERNPFFLHQYIDSLTLMNMDNSLVLDEYFKNLSDQSLKQDSTLLYLARQINNTHTATLRYVVKHYNELSDTAKAKVTNRLFDKVIRYAAGSALKEKRMMEYVELMAFGNELYGLNEKQKAYMNRMDLMYGTSVRDYPLIKKAGYIMVKQSFLIPVDTIRAEDKRRFKAIMQPYLTGKKDSTKIVDFQEEKKYLVDLYTREITDKLYTAAKAFAQLPAAETPALNDALAWIKKCYELNPHVKLFSELMHVLENKTRNSKI